MAEKDIVTLNEALPEVFGITDLNDSWTDEVYILDISSPDKPIDVSMNTELPYLDDSQLIDQDFFQPDENFRVDIPPEIEIESLGKIIGKHPGNLSTPTKGYSVAPTDCLAFYLPYHYYYPTWWGVYLLLEGVTYLANFIYHKQSGPKILSNYDCWLAARLYLFYHEIYHHNIETFASRLEISHRISTYKLGFNNYYLRTKGTPACLEESLAEANAYRKTIRFFDTVKKSELRAIFQDFINSSPPGYYEAGFYLGSNFIEGRNRFAEDNHHECFPAVVAKSPEIWNASKYLFRVFTDKGHGRAKYIINKSSPLVNRLPLRPRIKMSALKKKRQLYI